MTTVRAHPRRVPASSKNPSGFTIVDKHPRRIQGATLTANDLKEVAKQYRHDGLIYPSPNDLNYPAGNTYDELIAIWVDYFNAKYPPVSPNAPRSPDVVKALIASESGFDIDPPGNKLAIGIAQITPTTLKALQDADGEAKDFIFKDIRQKDLKDPEVGIPLAVRWLMRKRATATSKLGRQPNTEELILEYKGLLRSKTPLKQKSLSVFKEKYGKLIRK